MTLLVENLKNGELFRDEDSIIGVYRMSTYDNRGLSGLS
jgi:hypothetical protein